MGKISFPTKYICETCGSIEEYTKEDDLRLRSIFKVESDLPLFLECHMCHDGLMKPQNYTGKPSFVVPAL